MESDWQGFFIDAVFLSVAMLTIISAVVGIGLWLGILTTQQKQTKAELERLRNDFEEMLTNRRHSNRISIELSEDFLHRRGEHT